MFYKMMILLHILGACIWVGGHLVLALRILPSAWRSGRWEMIHDFEQHYEKIGIPALLVQVITGIWLALRYVPDWRAWFSFASFPANHIALKLLCLLLTILLALHARLVLIPKGVEANSMRQLGLHILGVTALAVIFAWLGVGFRTGGAW